MSTDFTAICVASITVQCEKRTRTNHNSDAVIARHTQNTAQFDWVISNITIGGVDSAVWCERSGVEITRITAGVPHTFRTQKAAHDAVVANLADFLQRAEPDFYDSDEYTARWEAIIASLQVGAQ